MAATTITTRRSAAGEEGKYSFNYLLLFNYKNVIHSAAVEGEVEVVEEAERTQPLDS